MGRSGILPATLGRVSPRRKIPINANHLQVGVCVLCFVFDVIFRPDNVFFTWAIFLTLSVLIMYVLANAGVVLYYWRAKRAQFNWILHGVIPAVTSVVIGFVFYKSVVPLPPYPEKWAPVVTAIWFAAMIGFLIYRRLRGGAGEAWMTKAQQAMDEFATGEGSALTSSGSDGLGD